MSGLYQLVEDYETVINMFDDGETDEQVIFDTLESIEGEIEDKADNYAKIIRNFKSCAEQLKAEEERIYSRRKSYESWADKLKGILEENLRFIGKTKFKTALFTFNIQKNGGKQPLSISENIDEIPMKYLIQREPLPNNEAIRELLEKKEVDWAHLEPRGESLRIR